MLREILPRPGQIGGWGEVFYIFWSGCFIAAHWQQALAAALFTAPLAASEQPRLPPADDIHLERFAALQAEEIRAISCNYLDITQRMMTEIGRVLEHEDFDEAAFLARRLKSSSRAVGASYFASLAQQLEALAAQGNGTRVRIMLGEMQRHYPKISDAMRAALQAVTDAESEI